MTEQEQPPLPDLDPDLIKKIDRFKSLQEQGIYFNDNLIASKSYRNPNIHPKLVEFLNVNQNSTNFDLKYWNPLGFPKDAYSDSIRLAQQDLADQKEKQRTSSVNNNKRSFIEFESQRNTSSSVNKSSSSSFKRDRDRPSDRERDSTAR
ncbi:hypothetical protein MJO28_009482 [Puccinia striiformis f. sp. tritici]|uniref:HCNGP-like protein n=4 Tax=Puccinia striiformis TaxID=27350 RepID=A0A2S4WJ53_9BASI